MSRTSFSNTEPAASVARSERPRSLVGVLMATDVMEVIRAKLATDFPAITVVAGDEWPDKVTSPNALRVMADPSPAPEATFGASYERKFPHFTVYCRDEKQGDARATALSVHDALRYHTPSGWVKIRPLHSHPIGPLRDGDGLPYFEVPFESMVEE